MRLNQFIAQSTGMSRRAADKAVNDGRVYINDQIAQTGQQVTAADHVTLDGHRLNIDQTTTTVMLNKPVGYVCSRLGQGSSTIYDLLPEEYQSLKPVGRLDKDSSGLILLTNDGQLAHRLMHPSFKKEKVYEVTLDKFLNTTDEKKIGKGVQVDDYVSRLRLTEQGSRNTWQVIMHEGRNRQIRRTFDALGYQVVSLHRIRFGAYELGHTRPGGHVTVAKTTPDMDTRSVIK